MLYIFKHHHNKGCAVVLDVRTAVIIISTRLQSDTALIKLLQMPFKNKCHLKTKKIAQQIFWCCIKHPGIKRTGRDLYVMQKTIPKHTPIQRVVQTFVTHKKKPEQKQ